MNTLKAIWGGLDWSVPLELILSVIPALICVTVHECSHGLAALAMGDTTARDRGRLSLNPLRHVDAMGLMMLVVFKIGWAKPVPIDMYRFKNPKRGMAISALAGPVSNILLSAFALLLYGLLFYPLYGKGMAANAVLETLSIISYMSLYLALFNLIPIPPLDGSKLVFSVVSDRAYYRLMYYEKYGMILLVALIAAGVLDNTLFAALSYVYDKLFYIAEFAFELIIRMFA